MTAQPAIKVAGGFTMRSELNDTDSGPRPEEPQWTMPWSECQEAKNGTHALKLASRRRIRIRANPSGPASSEIISLTSQPIDADSTNRNLRPSRKLGLGHDIDMKRIDIESALEMECVHNVRDFERE